MRPLPFGLLTLALAVSASAAEIRHIEPTRGIAKAVVVGEAPLIHTSQVFATDDSGKRLLRQPPALHADKALANLERLLKGAGSSLEQAVKLNVYAETDDVLPAVGAALARRFPGKSAPAVCSVVGKLAYPGARVCLDAVAVADGGMKRFTRDDLPRSPGESHAVVLPAGPVVYVAGQAERAATLDEATRKTLASLKATLQHLGLSLSDVVQVKSFLNPMSDAAAVQRVMHEFFGAELPAQVYVEWTYPQIEIELIAASPRTREKRASSVDYLTPPGMTASPVYSRIARINHGPRIYVSGLHGSEGDSVAQIKSIFGQLDAILQSAGSDLRHMAKATYYVSTEEASKKLNELRPDYYDPKRPPSASKAGVTSVGIAGRGIVLDMIAAEKDRSTPKK